MGKIHQLKDRNLNNIFPVAIGEAVVVSKEKDGKVIKTTLNKEIELIYDAISFNVVDDMIENSTIPITSGAVYRIVGNINELLSKI